MQEAISRDIILQTEKYKLRMPDATDIDFVFSATQYLGFNDGMQWDAPIHKDELVNSLENNIKNWIEGKGYTFTIESKEEPIQRLGRVSIRQTEEKDIWDVGYWIHPTQQKRGIMTEVLGTIIEFGFSRLNATSIKARFAIWNKASERVLTHNGFKFEKYIEKGFQKNGKWISENEFILTSEQWI
jgi:[ribosomal protein S5]-alanine N-acetyltransferase